MENPIVNGEVDSTTTLADSLPAENQNVETSADETQKFIDDFNKLGEDESSAEDSDQERSENEEKSPEEKPAEKTAFDRRKEQLNGEIQGLVGERNSLREERNSLREEIENMRAVVERQSAIDDGFVTADQLEATGLTREEAIYHANLMNHQAMIEQRQLDSYKAEIESLRNGLTVDRVELLRDYPIFDANSAEYNEDFTKKALEMYSRDANLQFDENGGVVSAGVRLYDYMKDVAELSEIRSLAAETNARKNIEKTMASVSPVGVDIVPSTNQTDAFVNSFFD